MVEQGVTSRTVSTRPETPSECSTTCGGLLSRAPRPSWRSTKAVWCPPYYDRERHHQTVSLPHKEPKENPANLLAWHHLQPTATRPLQSRQHGDHHHAMAMEMDWARHEERAGQHHSHSPSLDTWRKTQEEKTKKHWRRTVEAELKTMQHTWGTIHKLGRNRRTWRSFVAALSATRHNGHEWVGEFSQKTFGT